MKGILKIYHPEETLKYHIKSTYCKAVYSNMEYFLEIEIITDDSLYGVDDDSLQYNFPQLSLKVIEFPFTDAELVGKNFLITDNENDIYTEVNLFDDEEAFLYESKITFEKDAENELHLLWQGTICDFYTGSNEPIAFKLKCHFKPDVIEVEED